MVHLTLRGQPLGTAQPPADPARIAAVLFDKDGTMSQSEPMLLRLARARVEQCLALGVSHGLDDARLQQLLDLLARAYGLGTDGLHPAGTIAVAARDHNLISTATALVQVGLGWPEALALSEQAFASTDSLHGQGAPTPPQPTDGLANLLERLTAAGVRCAVISNDHQPGIQAFLRRHDLAKHFAGLWSADHLPRKPDPEAVHALCAELGVRPQSCALIGDANSDLHMARKAGVAVVLGYQDGWSQPVPLDPAFPQIHHWNELEVVD
jgi:phosphoglycolate phosphatase